MIPKSIYMTHESFDRISSKKKTIKCVNSWKKYPNYEFIFHDNKMREQFIKQHFDESVLNAYNKFPMGVMKADLWRYCVIYINGGIYADSDAECLCNPSEFMDNEALIVMAPENGNNFFCQWTFAAPAKSPILKEIIDLCVYRALNWEIKGEHIIHGITGPAMFTDAIKSYLTKNNLKTFDKCIDYVDYPSKIMKVFSPKIFHTKMICHHFAGDDADGWKKERKGILF